MDKTCFATCSALTGPTSVSLKKSFSPTLDTRNKLHFSSTLSTAQTSRSTSCLTTRSRTFMTASSTMTAPMPEKSWSDDYDSTFRNVPVGVSDILSTFSQSDVPLSSQRILEGGCGAGSYVAAVAPHVGTIIGMDASKIDVIKAKKKTQDLDNVTITEGNLLSMDRDMLKDHSMDSMMVNQVLHHIDDNDETFPNVTTFRDEAARVLKNGGILTVITSTHEQVTLPTSSYWYYKYIPGQVDKYLKRLIATPALIERIVDDGNFEHLETTPLCDDVFPQDYWDPRSMMSVSFRASDSVWSGITDEELSEARDKLALDMALGDVHKHMEETKRQVKDIGTAVMLSFRRV